MATGLCRFQHNLLGPAVPDEEVVSLLSKYYGQSLWVQLTEPGANGKPSPWVINVIAYDILVNLGASVSPGGMGAYQVTTRQETLHIDFQSYPVRFTVEQRDNQPVGELAMLPLEKDGMAFMFGYIQPKDDPAAYQAYLKAVWPELRQIVETYQKLPNQQDAGPATPPAVNAAALQDTSPQTVAQALFTQYLQAFLKDDEDLPDPQAKLSAYRIDEVDIPAKWQPCAQYHQAEFIASIVYSVKPERWPPERWAGGDGYLTFDQWIVRSSASIAVFRSGQNYTMKMLGVPVCPGY